VAYVKLHIILYDACMYCINYVMSPKFSDFFSILVGKTRQTQMRTSLAISGLKPPTLNTILMTFFLSSTLVNLYKNHGASLQVHIYDMLYLFKLIYIIGAISDHYFFILKSATDPQVFSILWRIYTIVLWPLLTEFTLCNIRSLFLLE